VGLFAVLVLGIRNVIMQIRRFQNLGVRSTEKDDTILARAASEGLGPVLVSAISIGVMVLPFAAFGDIAGLEIPHPAAVVILGGLVTSTALTLFVIPTLYPRFATKTETVEPSMAPEVA
jgi:Cu/Ag efflux pump CusA